MSFLRNRAAWIIAVLVVLLGGGGFVLHSQAQAKKAAAARAAAAATPKSLYGAIANGKADVEGGIIQVAARTAGIISEVDVQEGDEVHKGQVLARLEDDQPRLAAQSAQAALQQAEAQVELLKVQQSAAEREYNRLEKLVPSNFVAGQAVDKARDDVRQAKANLDEQYALIATTRAKLAEAKYNLELTIIRAPADGRIVRRYANPGAGASTLNVSNMFDLEPNTARIVRAEIPESALPAVYIGQPVQMSPEADPSKSFPGMVKRRAPVFGARKLQSDDPSERQDERVVEVVVSADKAPFLIGQRVLVKFVGGEKQAEAAKARATAQG